MAFPVAMHIPRLPLLVVASALALKVKLERWDHIFGPLSSYSMFVADGALQVAENCYCSGFLLYKVRYREAQCAPTALLTLFPSSSVVNSPNLGRLTSTRAQTMLLRASKHVVYG